MLKFILLAGLASFAALSLNDSWTLDRIVRHALEQAPIVKFYDKQIEKAHFSAFQAARWNNPDFAFAMGPVTQAGVWGHSLDLSFKQNIPLFGQKSVAKRLGLQHQKSAEIERDRELLTLKHQLVLLAYQYSIATELYQHIEHRRQKIDLVLKFLNSRPFVSPAQAVERDLIRYRIREIEEQFLDVSLAKQTSWQSLNVYLGLSAPVAIELNWKLGDKLPSQEYLKSLYSTGNLEVKKLENMIAAASVELELASKKKLPDFKIGASYNEQIAELPQRTVLANLEMSLPILDRGGYLRDSISAGQEAIKLQLQQKKIELESDFEQAWLRLQNMNGKLKLYPMTLLPDLEKQRTQVEQHWKRGLISAALFLEMESQVHRQTDKIYETQLGYVEALSQLEILAGQDFSLEGAGHAE